MPNDKVCLARVVHAIVTIHGACSAVGQSYLVCRVYSVAVGAQFFPTGIANVDQDIVPFLNRNLNGRVTPRVLPSYAILYWFSLQVS